MDTQAKKRNRIEISSEQISQQYTYMERVRDFVGTADASEQKRCYVETYGCQQNEADSETIRGMATEMGYRICNGPEEADLIVFNTCAIREHAEQRVFGNIGALLKYKRKKPGLVIALCGCMAGEPHIRERLEKSFPYVSLVFTTHVLWRFPELLFRVLVNGKRVFASDETGVIAEGLPLHRDRSVKGWLPIMYGCDNFCSYCIVPYVRGRERSRRSDEIIADAKRLIGEEGCRDITLLGQNVNSYGKGLDEEIDFPELIRKIDALDGEFLIRFMTSHPKDANERLFKAMAESKKAARHLHLPFQSGSDRILKLMNRGYTSGHYRELIALARSYMPDLVITSDVIVGFPGETEEDFEATMQLVKDLRFDALFTFIFSPRRGTKAYEMQDETPKADKDRRFQALVDAQNAISKEIHSSYIGKTVRVLVDGKAENKTEGYLSSRTSGGRLVVFPGDEGLIGTFRDVEIRDCTTWSLSGVLAE
ncbi:MAG: tRNA (N6-isopentenyl adenosine(37)-C2)-methylthiotransferase MiaB [Clostridia bacterium]|nr:tRNA (N6-isopentenyl adenosine(37)-C2)-methylthiotransferase MiaB [Clostridia bacterium]